MCRDVKGYISRSGQANLLEEKRSGDSGRATRDRSRRETERRKSQRNGGWESSQASETKQVTGSGVFPSCEE